MYKKLLVSFILALSAFGFVSRQSFALETSFIEPTVFDLCTNVSNSPTLAYFLTKNDGLQATSPNNSTNLACRFQLHPDIPARSLINSVTCQARGRRTGAGNENFQCSFAISGLNQSTGTQTSQWSDSGSFSDSVALSSGTDASPLEYNGAGSPNLTSTITGGSALGSRIFEFDWAQFKVNYSPPMPSVSITSEIASTAAQTMTLSITGDTKHELGIDNSCTVEGFLNKLSGNQNLPSAPVFLIQLNTTNTNPVTVNLGNNNYQGYSYTTSDTSWVADGVVVPYYSQTAYDIRFRTICHRTDTNEITVEAQGISQYQANWNDLQIASPSATAIANDIYSPECGNYDFVCMWLSGMRTILWDFFGIDAFWNPQPFYVIRDKSLTKVPFVYIYEVVSLDFSQDPVATTSPTVLFSFSDYAGQGQGAATIANLDDVEVNTEDTGILGNFGEIIKSVLSIALWLGFVLYIIAKIKHVL